MGFSQGEHLEAPLECVFSNGTLSLAVRAAVTDARNATCKAPAWPLSRSGAHAAPSGLTVAPFQGGEKVCCHCTKADESLVLRRSLVAWVGETRASVLSLGFCGQLC